MLLKIFVFLSVICIIFFSYFWIKVRPRLGANPSGKYLSQISTSPNYDKKKSKFVNFQESLIIEAEKNVDTWKILFEFLFSKNQVTPKEKIPQVIPDLNQFASAKEGVQLIWFGHSTFLININGKIILIDPVFSNSASPVDFLVQRFQDPVVALKNLPKIDAIVISHDHYDHLDSRTIASFKGSEVHFFVPLGIASHLESWGIKKTSIQELDWWESTLWEGIEIVCTPAQHFSGRVSTYENKTLWASWIMKSDQHNIYYSGDSGYGPHFKEIGEKFGPFDISLIENGQYDDQWKPVHLHLSESAQAYFDLKSKAMIPIHWGMFNMALHNWYDPIEEIEKFAEQRNINLLTPKIGQLIDLNNLDTFNPWWKNLLPAKK